MTGFASLAKVRKLHFEDVQDVQKPAFYYNFLMRFKHMTEIFKTSKQVDREFFAVARLSFAGRKSRSFVLFLYANQIIIYSAKNL